MSCTKYACRNQQVARFPRHDWLHFKKVVKIHIYRWNDFWNSDRMATAEAGYKNWHKIAVRSYKQPKVRFYNQPLNFEFIFFFTEKDEDIKIRTCVFLSSKAMSIFATANLQISQPGPLKLPIFLFSGSGQNSAWEHNSLGLAFIIRSFIRGKTALVISLVLGFQKYKNKNQVCSRIEPLKIFNLETN